MVTLLILILGVNHLRLPLGLQQPPLSQSQTWMQWHTHNYRSMLVPEGPVKKWACRARPPAKPPWDTQALTQATSIQDLQDNHLCSSSNSSSNNHNILEDSIDHHIQALVEHHKDKICMARDLLLLIKGCQVGITNQILMPSDLVLTSLLGILNQTLNQVWLHIQITVWEVICNQTFHKIIKVCLLKIWGRDISKLQAPKQCLSKVLPDHLILGLMHRDPWL